MKLHIRKERQGETETETESQRDVVSVSSTPLELPAEPGGGVHLNLRTGQAVSVRRFPLLGILFLN